MAEAARGFQVFVKPAGAACNLGCRYCYYIEKDTLRSGDEPNRMSHDILEEYIAQHIEASPDQLIRFSWHGGEPTILGLDFFIEITELQKKLLPPGRRIVNGMQTNGILLDKEWGRFLAAEGFSVGLSMDGPEFLHDRFRLTKDGKPSHAGALRGYEILREHGVACDILCVVNADNVKHPAEVYRFFKRIEAPYVSFLPLVERAPNTEEGVLPFSVPAESWGNFLCFVFDEWLSRDIGRIKVQIFEEAARTAFGQEHSLCIFRPVCGDIPVIEKNGDFYSCDHFVDEEHRLGNILKTHLAELLESPVQRTFGRAKLERLPRTCRECGVREMCNGGCPKNRFIRSQEGEAGLNYLCAGYKLFFSRCRPWVEAVADEWNRKDEEDLNHARPGRNDPCPCGSGLKYKKCCGR